MTAKYKTWSDSQLKDEVVRLRREMKSTDAPYSSSYYRNELRILARILESRSR